METATTCGLRLRNGVQPTLKSLFILAGILMCSLPAAAQCTWALTPANSAHVTAARTTGQFGVVLSSGAPACSFASKSNNPDWLQVAFGQSGGSGGSVGYTVLPSTLYTQRTGSISVGNAIFTVIQDAFPCTYTFTPAAQTVQPPGGNFSLAVGTACTWTATSTVPWLSINAGGSGTTGNGTLSYTADPNTAVATRSTNLRINDQNLPVTQFGTGCTYLVDPLAASFTAAGGTGKLSMQADNSCPWTVSNPAPWIGNVLVNGAAPGNAQSGNAAITYNVEVNNSSQTRYAELAVGGQQVTITQAGVGILFSYFQVVNGASFQNGQIAPGELITIFGSGLGPTTGASLQLTADGGYVTSSLGGTRVLFDGMPAPVTYASDGQVNAIVPFALDGSVSTKIQVEFQGTASSPVTMFLAPASPAIFAAGAGTGQGAVLNQDNSYNSAANPAPAGSVLQIFATGAGQTNPAGVDGQLAGNQPSIPLVSISATLGDLDAPVQYAGTSSGLVAGVLQVNVVIPPNAPAGSAVPLTIKVGGIPSQQGITVAIR